MNYYEDKEVIDLINHIKNINIQIANPTEQGVRDVIKDVQKILYVESVIFELTEANGELGNITSLDNIDFDILYNKLTFYKSLCEDKLIKKLGEEIYKEMKKKYNL